MALANGNERTKHIKNQIPLYPLRFEPIYQYRLWGGRRLANLLSAPLPGDGPIRDPNESKRVIEAIVACLGDVQTTKPREEKTG